MAAVAEEQQRQSFRVIYFDNRRVKSEIDFGDNLHHPHTHSLPPPPPSTMETTATLITMAAALLLQTDTGTAG